MKFEEVLPLLRQGKRIRRKGWPDVNAYWYLQQDDDELELLDEFNESITVFVESTLMNDDWETVEDNLAKDAWKIYHKRLGSTPLWNTLSANEKEAWQMAVQHVAEHYELKARRFKQRMEEL